MNLALIINYTLYFRRVIETDNMFRYLDQAEAFCFDVKNTFSIK